MSAPVDTTTVVALWRLSRGNVLHLRGLVRGGLASGELAARSGLWAWSAEPHAPPRLAELLAERLATLAPEQRRAVELLALGEPLTWSHLAALVPTGEAESLVAAGLAETETVPPRADAVDEDRPAEPRERSDEGELVVRLAHPLLGDVLEGRDAGADPAAVVA